MPAISMHYRLLNDRLQELSCKFVDDQVAAEHNDPTTFQPDLDRLAAFRLLMHAELEDFLESMAKDYLDDLAAKSASGSTWMRMCPGLIALAVALHSPTPEITIVDNATFVTYANTVLGAAKKMILRNNGIKAQSFLLLSMCAGKAFDEVDYFLSGTLNSYGKTRGDIAHKSVRHTNSLQAPSTELAHAHSLVSQLASYFDVSF